MVKRAAGEAKWRRNERASFNLKCNLLRVLSSSRISRSRKGGRKGVPRSLHTERHPAGICHMPIWREISNERDRESDREIQSAREKERTTT